jgi:hypothetical protein
MSAWLGRLHGLVSGECASADSANSAISLPIGTNGTIGIGTDPENGPLPADVLAVLRQVREAYPGAVIAEVRSRTARARPAPGTTSYPVRRVIAPKLTTPDLKRITLRAWKGRSCALAT